MREREQFGKDPKYSENYGLFNLINGQEVSTESGFEGTQLQKYSDSQRKRREEILEGVENQVRFITEHTDISKGTAIDLGSNIGAHAVALLKSGFTQVIALDRDESSLRAAGQIFEGHIEKAQFVCGDFREIPLQDDSVNLALLINSSLGGLFSKADDKRILEEVRRILVPNGSFALTVDYADFGIRYYQEKGELLSGTQTYKLVEQESNGSWIIYFDIENKVLTSEFRDKNDVATVRVRGRFQTYQEYRDLITNAGFTIEGVWNDNEKGVPFDIDSSSRTLIIARKSL